MTRVNRARPLLASAVVVLFVACDPPGDQDGPPPEMESVAADSVAATDDRDTAVVSQTVYVPDYAHVYHGNDRTAYALTTTLSVRNTDPERPITLGAVRYYDTEGELTRRFIDRPRRLGPFGTAEFVVAEHDVTGGSGANFIVEWHAARPVSPPLIESVMIGTRSGQGISFTSRGQPIERYPQ